MTADDDRSGPARHKARNVLADDWLAEYCTSEDVPDCTVRAQPHLLQLEFYQVDDPNKSYTS